LKDALTIASGRDENRFEVTGLAPAKRGLVPTPHREIFPWSWVQILLEL